MVGLWEIGDTALWAGVELTRIENKDYDYGKIEKFVGFLNNYIGNFKQGHFGEQGSLAVASVVHDYFGYGGNMRELGVGLEMIRDELKEPEKISKEGRAKLFDFCREVSSKLVLESQRSYYSSCGMYRLVG